MSDDVYDSFSGTFGIDILKDVYDTPTRGGTLNTEYCPS